jgi:hypothetical protein
MKSLSFVKVQHIPGSPGSESEYRKSPPEKEGFLSWALFPNLSAAPAKN